MPAQPLVQSILRHANQQPTNPALVWRGQQTTYAELVELAVSAHAELGRLAGSTSAAVGILAKKSPQSVALVLGCLMARRPFLLPSVDLGPAALELLLGDAGCEAVLSVAEGQNAAHSHLVTNVVQARTATSCGTASLPSPAPDETTFMLTTSGSTGPSKIVPLSAGAVDRFTEWAAARFDLRPGTTVLNHAPLNFDLGLLDLWATLRAGGCVVLVDQDRAMSPGYLLDALTRTEVHLIQAVPMLYRLLLEATRVSRQSFPSVEHVIFTGESLPRRVLDALPKLFPCARLYNVYGCTETNDSFICEVDDAILARYGPLPVGEPLPGVSAVVMADGGGVLAGHGTGELWVATPFQTSGYLSASMTAEKFVQHRHDGVERTYFRTGDLVRRDGDGAITLLGRNDLQLKVRAIAVNLQEIERTMLDHEAVVEAAVVALPDELAGKRLHALVRRRLGAELNSLSLREYCAARLPRAAIPSTVRLTDEPLPRTPTGKLDRQAITKLHRLM